MARKKYEALPTSRGSGLVAQTHNVKLSDGTTATLVNQGRTPLARASAPVDKAKVAVLNRLPQQEAQFRRIMRRVIKEFEAELRKADKPNYRRIDGSLRAPTVKRLEGLLDLMVRQAVRDMRDNVLSNIEGATKTYIRAVAQAHPNRIVASKDVATLARQIAVSSYTQVVGGATASQRVAVLGARLEGELKALIGLPKEDRAEKRDRLNRRLVDNQGSHEACVTKGLQRLNRTEQSRSMQRAAVEILKKSGETLAYWRLSPAHKDYGGGEVCEVLASSTGEGVDAELIRLGLSAPREGLYLLTKFPETPHANCMCSVDIML